MSNNDTEISSINTDLNSKVNQTEYDDFKTEQLLHNDTNDTSITSLQDSLNVFHHKLQAKHL